MSRQILLSFIRIYQRTLSPDHGWLRIFYLHGCCRFVPSCSQYGYEAVAKYGTLRGSYLAFRRVLRCNPFHSSGLDPLL